MHDVVVVGAGGSGVPLAARLADSGASVLLLEAGPGRVDPAATDARRVPGARAGHHGTRAYGVRLTPTRDGGVLRGRGLGGSTAVNGAYFVRPRPDDLDRWASVGGERWSYASALPLMRALETDLDLGASGLHGDAGPVPVRRTSLEHPAAAALVRAARSLGHADDPDKNGTTTTGVGPVPSNVVDGRRVDVATAYLPRPGLTVRGDAAVSRVVLDGGRATGVVVAGEVVPAGEVVLCAGAYGSPQLLMLSGIGPAGDLRALDLDVVVDLPVGRTLSDHPQVVVEWTPSAPCPELAHWLGAVVHLTSSGSRHEGDLEVLQSLLPMASLTAGTLDAGPLPLLVSAQHPVDRGRLTLASADPTALPVVEARYLDGPDDRRRLREGVRAAAALVDAMGEAAVALDRHTLDDDPALDAWVADRIGTSVHACSTTPVGPVVDGVGRVHGVTGLRVADTGILPTAPLRGPALAAVLVGELVAAALLEH